MFIEKDFIDDKRNIKMKNLGLYFKCMFLENIHLTPTEAKIKFTQKFKKFKIETKEIKLYIETKYREANKISKEKIRNYNSFIDIKDDEGNNLSNIVKFLLL